MKNILQRDNQKKTRKYNTSTYLTVLLNRTVKKVRRGGGGGGVNAGGKIEYIYLKLKKKTISKQWYWKSICSHYIFNRSL